MSLQRQAKVIMSDAYELALSMRQDRGKQGHLARTICYNINNRYPEIKNFVEESNAKENKITPDS